MNENNPTAYEMIEQIVIGITDGMNACAANPKASTNNLSVHHILNSIREGVYYARNEIDKGNVK